MDDLINVKNRAPLSMIPVFHYIIGQHCNREKKSIYILSPSELTSGMNLAIEKGWIEQAKITTDAFDLTPLGAECLTDIISMVNEISEHISKMLNKK